MAVYRFLCCIPVFGNSLSPFWPQKNPAAAVNAEICLSFVKYSDDCSYDAGYI
jgi:hypothetical protein